MAEEILGSGNLVGVGGHCSRRGDLDLEPTIWGGKKRRSDRESPPHWGNGGSRGSSLGREEVN